MTTEGMRASRNRWRAYAERLERQDIWTGAEIDRLVKCNRQLSEMIDDAKKSANSNYFWTDMARVSGATNRDVATEQWAIGARGAYGHMLRMLGGSPTQARCGKAVGGMRGPCTLERGHVGGTCGVFP